MTSTGEGPAHPFPEYARVREELVKWFTKYGGDTRYEIEFRIQDVGEAGFERLLSSLLSHQGWSNKPAPVITLDKVHATGVRETVSINDTTQPTVFMKKIKGPHMEMQSSMQPSYTTRFAVASEEEKAADQTEVLTYRHKQRYTFEHKGLFKFELTRVKQGTTDQVARNAETGYEVELEFCGQESKQSSNPEYLADSMLMKAADLLHQLAGASRSDPAPNKRQRAAADGTPQECDEVTLQEGTEVKLGPSSHGAKPHYGGEMPAELAQMVPWLFSHFEKDGSALIMSEPANVGHHSYPLFYFCGTVPASAIRRRS